MSSCQTCGKHTNGYTKCYTCYSGGMSKAGKVYLGASTRKDGSTKLYVGQTKKSVYKRTGGHMGEVKKANSKTWTGRGTGYKILGSVFSTNRYKAEKTIKSKSPSQKRRIFSKAKKGSYLIYKKKN